MMEINNSTLKSEILSSFKAKFNDTLTSNNNALSLQISNDLDNKFIQFQSYLMNSVKELVTEMSLLRTLSTPLTNVKSLTNIIIQETATTNTLTIFSFRSQHIN